MRLVRQLTLAAALIGSSVVAQAVDLSKVPSGSYAVDPTHAYVNFQYTHLGLSRPMLQFDDFDVVLELDNADVSKSSIEVVIDPKSIQAGSDIWKSHLTGGDYFDVGAHPEITYNSTSIEKTGDDTLKVMGDLTIKGESQPVELEVQLLAAMDHPMSGDPVIGFTASGQLLRSAFGLGKFAPNVSDEIDLTISAEVTQ